MRSLPARILALALVGALSPACIVLDGCDTPPLAEGTGGGLPTSTAASAVIGSNGSSTGEGSASASAGGDGGSGAGDPASSTSTGEAGGEPGSSGSGGAGGVPTDGYEICGNGVDEDGVGGDAECPAGHWWHWFADDPTLQPTAYSVAILDDGSSVTSGVLTDGTYFVARVDANGEELWMRTIAFDGSSRPLLVVAHDQEIRLVGTADGVLDFDEGGGIGEAGKKLGFVAELDAEDGTRVGPPLYLRPDDDGNAGETTAQAAHLVKQSESSWELYVAGSTTTTLDDVPGPTLFVTIVSDDLDAVLTEPLVGSIAAAEVPLVTSITATSTHVAVAIWFGGAIVTLQSEDVAPSGRGSLLQEFLRGPGGLMDRGGRLFDCAGGTAQIDAMAFDGENRLHVAVSSDAATSLQAGPTPIPAEVGDLAVHARLNLAGGVDFHDSLGSGVTNIDFIAVLDDQSALVVAGRSGKDGVFLGRAEDVVEGLFIAELALGLDEDADGEEDLPSATWTSNVAVDVANAPKLALDPASGNPTLRVVGLHVGDATIGFEDRTHITPFVARYGR